MITTKIKSGKTEIISSGIAITFHGQPVEIKFGDESTQITIIFEFEEDKTKEGIPSINATTDGLVLKINLINFNNPLGSGSSAPIQIGTFHKKLLFLNFRVYQIGNSNEAEKTLQYCIYLAEEAK